MNKKLYVGNLPYNVTETELSEAFGAHGSVASARIITDKFSGRSKGFGFVEMATEEEAQKAVDGMNGKELSGRAITVSEARPEQPRTPRTGGFGGGYEERSAGGGGGGGRRNFRDRNGGSTSAGPGGGGGGFGRGRGRGGGGGYGGGGSSGSGGGGGGFDDDNFGNR